MKESKDEVKKIIRALLISAKHGLTTNQLCSEYTAINCRPLPYKELGYFSAIDLVKDMPDVVRPFFLPGGVILLKGVADSSTAHINALVSRQKTTGVNSRIVSALHVKKPTKKIVPNFIRSKILDLISLYPEGIELHSFEINYQKLYGQKLVPERIGFNSVRAILIECPDIVSIKLKLDETFIYPVQCEDTRGTTNAGKTYCKPKIGISNLLKQEISDVLKRRRNGIWMARFPFEYKDLHKKDFDIQNLGFNNIIELMVKLENNVFISRPVPNGDWILYAKEYEPFADSTLLQHSDYALIDTGQWSELIEICISYIIDPSTFWFQVAEYVHDLDQLAANMNNFYHNRRTADRLKLKRGTAQANQVCCALYEDGNWYRAVIKNVLPYERAQVFYVDYGNEVTIEIASLRMLDKPFLSLPCQALQAKLYGTLPDEGNTWSKKAVELFYELTSDRQLYAKVMDKGDALVVDLIDTNGKEDINIADGLRSHMNQSVKVINLPEASDVQVKAADQRHTDNAMKLHQFYSEYYQTLQHVSKIAQVTSQQLVTDSSATIQHAVGEHRPETSSTTTRDNEISDQSPACEKQTCFLKRVNISENVDLHLLRYKGTAYVTSAQISTLFWEADILRQMLRQKALKIERDLLLREDNKELFDLLIQHKVNGIMNGNDIRSFVAIYRFSRLPKLLEMFKCLYSECQEKVMAEIKKLELLSDEYWSFAQEYNFEEQEVLRLQGLKFKRKRLYLTMMTNCATTSTIHDLQVLEKQISCLEKKLLITQG